MSEKKPTSLHRPGQIFRYNNTNYAILACIIEKVTQAPFEDFVDHEIFEPIGMYDSFIFRNGFVPRIENSAIGFSGKFARNDKLIDGIVGDKGIYSSAVDLLKFHLALENNFILTDSSQRKMYAGFDDMKGIKDYGLGWRLFKDGSGIVYHRGWWNGFKNNFLRIPQRNACVIVLSNNDQTKPMDMSKMFKLMGININEHEFDFE
jgi:CubicO group peptidase (beta-lactamase class C family)